MSTKWTCENRPKGRHNDGNLTARALRFLARAHSLLPASSKTLVTVRAFQMLRVHLRSLCGRDAVATMRAVNVEGCAEGFEIVLATAWHSVPVQQS